MSIQGVRLTDNFVTDARPKNWREGIMLLFPNGSAPLFALTAGMKKRVTDDPEFNWWDKSMSSQRVALGADLDDGTGGGGDQDITVGATGGVNNALIQGFKAGTVLRVEETGELMLVDTDPASGGTVVGVLRGWAGTTPTAVTYDGAGVNPFLQSVGSVHEENSDAPTGVSFDPNKRTNFTQIFRDTLEMSRTAQKTRLRTGNQVKESKRETLEVHSANIERAMWFGAPYEAQTINGRIARNTGGVFNYIDPGNIVTATSAEADMDDLEGWLEQAFRFGSSEKMGFCGNQALLAINQIARKNSSMEMLYGQKEFGMNVSRLVCPFGTVVLKTHPLWNQIRGGSTGGSPFYGVNSWLAILDMANFTYRPLVDGDTKYQPVLQGNGIDGMKSGYLTEAGLEVAHPTTHFLIKNLNAGKADS